jgi:alkanesulfonate monooxygenase SsuD/methylene tetrahydromethanopterin reductase-like flavin-dependent oxidoreductase (luciferase family)
MVSTLDHFCNGRLEIGIGAGWYEKEFVAAGLKYRPNMWRIKQLDEALTVLRELWKGKPLTFKGNFYSLRDAICLPPPRQRPHPPLWIGGKGNLMLRVVARHAQVWNTRASIEEYQERLSVLQSIVKTIGRTDDLQRSLLVFAALGKNEAEAKEKLRMVKEQRPPLWEILTSGSLSKKLQLVREKPKLIPFLVKRLIESSPSNVFCGTYEQFVDYLIQFVKIGVNHFAFYLVGQTDLRTLIDEIKMLCE